MRVLKYWLASAGPDPLEESKTEGFDNVHIEYGAKVAKPINYGDGELSLSDPAHRHHVLD